MEEQFIKLQQWNQSVYEYAAEFLRLSHFAQYMVVTKRSGQVDFIRDCKWISSTLDSPSA